jgi:hypothetical protein
MSPFEIYVMLKLDDLRTLFGIVGWLSVAGIAMTCIHMSCSSAFDADTRPKAGLRLLKRLLVCAAAMLACWTLTPSCKDAAVMLVGSSLASSEVVAKDMPADAAELCRLAVAALKEKLTPSAPRERK